jgi:alpha-1,2-mannosyltransferase
MHAWKPADMTERLSLPALGAVLGLQVAVVLYVTLTHEPIDLHMYLWGGQVVGHGDQLYLAQEQGHWFTNTPFAALLFAPLARMPDVLVLVLWDLGSIGACALAGAASLRLAEIPVTPRRVLLLTILALLLEPVWHTLFSGQINLFLLAVILVDLHRVATGRLGGVGIGLVTAVKLTPAIFIVLLLLARRTRSALVATGAFLVFSIVGFIGTPDAARRYWSGVFMDTHRLGAPGVGNQSPFGLLLRVSGIGRNPEYEVGPWYLFLPLVIGLVGLGVAVVHARYGDWLAAASVTAVTGLLVSPISWTHHWVWVIPVLVLLWRSGHVGRRLAVGTAVLFLLTPLWWTPQHGVSSMYGWNGVVTVAANSYLIAGTGFLLYQARRARHRVAADASPTGPVRVPSA